MIWEKASPEQGPSWPAMVLSLVPYLVSQMVTIPLRSPVASISGLMAENSRHVNGFVWRGTYNTRADADKVSSLRCWVLVTQIIPSAETEATDVLEQLILTISIGVPN